MSGEFNEAARVGKRGGGVVFIAMFLSPFVALVAVILTRVIEAAPLWAPIAALALAHWILVAAYVRAKKTANVIVWSVAAVFADVLWFGVLLTLADAVG